MLRSTISSIARWERLKELLRDKTVRRLRRAIAVLVAAAAANALIYGAFVAPAAGHLSAEQGKVAELRRRHADALLFQKQKQVLAGLNEGILKQKDVPLLLKDLVQMARKRGLKAEKINSDIPSPSAGGLTQLAFNLPLSGNYANCKRFIHDMETADRLVGIQGVRFSTEKRKVKMELKLITYIRGE